MTDTVTTPGSVSDPGVRRFQSPLRAVPALRVIARYLGVAPFAAYVSIFLIVPMVAIAAGAFQNPNTGAFTWSNIDIATHGVYLKGFQQSIELSLLASIIPGIFGFLISYAIFTARGRAGSLLRQVVLTLSGVFSQFGGVPLAFVFIASLGSSALVTGWLTDIHLNIYAAGFSLYTLSGVVLVYMYFQIPLMVLIMLPALSGLRPAWREAAENLGAGTWQYWRYVGGQVLLPSFLACLMLLFGSALAAYATAEALTTGTIALTSIQIGTFLNGNVIAGQQNVGQALSLGMVVIIALLMTCYVLLQRRAAKWLR